MTPLFGIFLLLSLDAVQGFSSSSSSSSSSSHSRRQRRRSRSLAAAFDDFAFGESEEEEDDSDNADPISSSAILKDRMQSLQQQEARSDAVQGRNWKMANWRVTGMEWNSTVSQLLLVTNSYENDEPMLVVGDVSGNIVCMQWIDVVGTRKKTVLGGDDSIDYEVVQEWKAQAPVVVMAADDDYLYTSDGVVIQQWNWEDTTEPVNTLVSPCHTLATVATDKMVSVHKGGINIWSKDCVLLAEFKSDVSITSAAVDEKHVYVGLENGDVVVHSLAELLVGQQEQDSVLEKWSATRDETGSITSLAVGGVTRLGGQTALVIYTGDAAGTVKQWFLLQQGEGRIHVWPKLSTQRVPKKAHLFAGHRGQVETILAVDGVKFVTASLDGSGWNTSTGKEFFSMEGFPEAVTSLAILDGMLATNGMENCLPLNDFTVDDDDFDLEMPEYID